MLLPLGVVDPIFQAELCLEMGKSLAEIEALSAYEVGVFWPNFFAYRKREHDRQMKEAAKKK